MTITSRSAVMPVYTYTTFDDPSANSDTEATGINNTGQIAGLFRDNRGGTHGFLLSGGTYTAIDDPLATTETRAQGINNAGQIVGWYANNSGSHGFLLANGLYAALDDPSATQGTTAFGINNRPGRRDLPECQWLPRLPP
jgi:probable HAF family extracellular repeat protein